MIQLYLFYIIYFVFFEQLVCFVPLYFHFKTD
eukprot:UN15860